MPPTEGCNQREISIDQAALAINAISSGRFSEPAADVGPWKAIELGANVGVGIAAHIGTADGHHARIVLAIA
jgi:hypothetical protein